jgi:hypothetical protein
MSTTPRLDDRLKEYAPTPTMAGYIDAVNTYGGIVAAAKALGHSDYSHLSRSISKIKRLAAAAGYSPEHDMTRTVPEGFKVKGVSTYYDEDGKVRGQWVKSTADGERQEVLVREILQTMAQEVKGLAPSIPAPERVESDLLAAIPVGDPHNGLYTWARECGSDFDTDIARRLAIAASDRLIASSPACSVGIFLLLGDVFHANDQTNATPGHKHQLDVDSRFVKVIGVAIETYRHIILRMLEKFGKVVVKLIPGNHDPQAIWALAYALHAYFSNEPRVEVDLGPSKFWYYQFGKVLIGSTHGDTVKPERLPGIMAADKPEEWGASKFRYWYTGHIHSKNAIEFPGVQWESFRTLAAQDAYAASHGYRSGRDMVLIVHHKDHGEVERHRCDVGMLA